MSYKVLMQTNLLAFLLLEIHFKMEKNPLSVSMLYFFMHFQLLSVYFPKDRTLEIELIFKSISNSQLKQLQYRQHLYAICGKINPIFYKNFFLIKESDSYI